MCGFATVQTWKERAFSTLPPLTNAFAQNSCIKKVVHTMDGLSSSHDQKAFFRNEKSAGEKSFSTFLSERLITVFAAVAPLYPTFTFTAKVYL